MTDVVEADVGSARDAPPNERKRWVPPSIDDLPRLTDLTLQTGSPIGGGGDTGLGGSSVF